MATLQIDWTDETGALRSFITPDARWDGSDWNGFPAPQLPKWQWLLLLNLIGEDAGPHPELCMEGGIDAANRGGVPYEKTAESDYVWADGLTWHAVDVEVR
jgi:hypothetical protein